MIKLQEPKFCFTDADLVWWKTTALIEESVFKDINILFVYTKLYILILSSTFALCLNSWTNDIDTIRFKCSYQSH